MGQLLHTAFEHKINIQDAGAILPPTSKFVWLKNRIFNLVVNCLGVVSAGNGNWK